jgi:SAM-dependent methyltransferase
MAYALPNAWEQARERLALLEAAHDASSIRHAEALGVGPGWECLEAGAGGGSFARWLAGRAGRVVAADLDVRHLDGLEAWQVDLAADDLPEQAFDFVHTRLVLLHIPRRDEVLAKLVAALRPGGVLLLEEDDIHPVLATARGGYREAWLAFLKAMSAGGTDPEWARELPVRLDALGLKDVEAELEGQLFRGGSGPAEFWSLTWEQVRERFGDDAVLDAGQAELADSQRWFHGPVKVVAWGYRA